MCCPFPTQPGHPLVRPYLSKMFYRKCTLCARLPLSNSSFCWIVGFCCVLLAVAFHGLPTHRFQNCKSQNCKSQPLSPSRRLTQRVFIASVGVQQQQELIGAVKLADKNSSYPLGSVLRKVSPQAHVSKWHNFSSVVLASKTTIRRPPGSLHLEIVYNPCTMSYHSSPSTRDPVQPLFCISWRRLLEMPEAVPELSNSLVLYAASSLSSLLVLQSRSEAVD